MDSATRPAATDRPSPERRSRARTVEASGLPDTVAATAASRRVVGHQGQVGPGRTPPGLADQADHHRRERDEGGRRHRVEGVGEPVAVDDRQAAAGDAERLVGRAVGERAHELGAGDRGGCHGPRVLLAVHGPRGRLR